MAIISEGSIIGAMFLAFTTNITGNFYISYLCLMFFFIAIGLLFRLPLLFIAILLLPLFILLGLISSSLLPALIISIILIGIALSNYFANRY